MSADMSHSKEKDVGKAEAKPERNVAPKFVFPELPRWELFIHFAVITTMFFICWYQSWYLSWTLPEKVRKGRWEMERAKDAWHWLSRWRDGADFEWTCFKYNIFRYIECLLLSSAVFNAAHRWIKNEDRRKFVLALTGGLLTCWFMGHRKHVLIMFGQGLSFFVTAKLLPYQTLVWAEAALFLWYNTMPDGTTEWEYPCLVIKQYCLFQHISFTVEALINNPVKGRSVWGQLLDHLDYYLYFPFKFHLIMPYPQWEKRLRERETQPPRPWLHITFYAARLAFWGLTLEAMRHVIYFRPVSKSLCPLEEGAGWLSNPRHESRIWQASLQFCAGIAFHMKYAFIFGVPSVALHLDKMQPLEPPVCVSRVALYSRIWREFDRGLYLFVKYQVYIPICRPTFSVWRKLAAGALVFTVVVVWHDANYAVITWIGLNVFVLVAKGCAEALYQRNSAVRGFCCERLSPVAFRRLIGLLHAPLVIISLVSIFYFLIGPNVGDWIWELFIKRDWLGGPSWNALGQIALGYSFAQFSIQLQIWLEARKVSKSEPELWKIKKQ